MGLVVSLTASSRFPGYAVREALPKGNTMQIHNSTSSTKLVWSLDPSRGPVQQTERVVERGGATRITVPKGGFASTPDGATFELQPDGTFHVPDDIGAFYVRTPNWFEGSSPFPPPEMVAEFEKSTDSQPKAPKSRTVPPAPR
jgi:hypothetical protein